MFKDRPQAFVAMPFGKKSTLTGEVDFDSVRALIGETLESLGMESARLEPNETGSSSLEEIRRSDFVVGDVTGSNPNVMLEVGMAIGLGKPLLLISMSRSSPDLSLPADILTQQVAVYSVSDLDSVAKYVELMAKDALARSEVGTSTA